MNQLYGDYSFYEFTAKEFEYYALIWAENEESAVKCYENEVCERDELSKWGKPEKVAFFSGVEAIMKTIGDHNEDEDADIFYTLKSLFTKECPQVILISTDLI